VVDPPDVAAAMTAVIHRFADQDATEREIRIGQLVAIYHRLMGYPGSPTELERDDPPLSATPSAHRS